MRLAVDLADDAADLGAGDEREVGLHLVLAAGLEQLGKRDAGGADVDDDAAARGHRVLAGRLGDVADLQRGGGAGELGDLDGAHVRG